MTTSRFVALDPDRPAFRASRSFVSGEKCRNRVLFLCAFWISFWGLGPLAGSSGPSRLGSIGPTSVLADVVVLKNGNEIRGKIKLDAGGIVEIEVPYGKLQIERREIDRIDRETNAEYLEKAGESMLRHHDIGRGLELLRESYRVSPNTRTRQALVLALSTMGQRSVSKRRLRLARQLTDEGLELSPENAELLVIERRLKVEASALRALSNEAQAAIDKGELAPALLHLRALFERFPDVREEWRDSYSKVSVLVGHSALKAGDFDRARLVYRDALRQEPDLVEVLREPLAFAETQAAIPLLQRGLYHEAQQQLIPVRELLPNNPAVLYYLAVSSEGAGDVAAAAKIYSQLAGPQRDAIRPNTHVADLRRAAEASLSGTKTIDLVAPKSRWADHTRQPGVLSSSQFEIRYSVAERGKSALRQLEYHLERLQKQWCRGQSVLPRQIDVFLYHDRAQFQQAVSPPPWSPAITRNDRRFGRLFGQELHFDASDPQFESSTIAHELCHILLPHLIGAGKEIPLWIDEGVATGEEPRFKQDYYDRVIREANQSDSLFPLSELVSATNYPEEHRVAVFYAQSNAIVRFLKSRLTTKDLLALFSQAADGELDAALPRYTRFIGVPHLERTWRASIAEQ